MTAHSTSMTMMTSVMPMRIGVVFQKGLPSGKLLGEVPDWAILIACRLPLATRALIHNTPPSASDHQKPVLRKQPVYPACAGSNRNGLTTGRPVGPRLASDVEQLSGEP